MLEMFRWWLENDTKYTAEQMTMIYNELIIKAKLSVAKYADVVETAVSAEH